MPPRYVWLLGILLVLTACEMPLAVPTRTPVARLAVLTVSPTSTREATATRPGPTPTLTAPPSATAVPSATATPTRAPTITPTPSQTPTNTATPDLTPTQSLWLTLVPSAEPDGVQLEVVNQVGGAITAVAVEGGLAYVGVGPRLVIMDVSNPQTPVMVGQSDILPAIVRDVVVREGFAYVATGTAGVWVVDVTNPVRPRPVTFAATSIPAYQLKREGGVLYAIDRRQYLDEGRGWLSISSLADPAGPVEVGTLAVGEEIDDLAVVGNYVYLVSSDRTDGALVVVEVTNPSSPVQVATLPDVKGSEITIVGDRAYIHNSGSLLVVDLSEPANPAVISTRANVFDYGLRTVVEMEAGSDALFLAVNGGDAGSVGSDIFIVPAGEIETGGSYPVGGFITNDIAVQDGMVYVAGQNELLILDASDLNQMVDVGRFRAGGVYEIAMEGAWLYGQTDSQVTVFDRSEPVQPITWSQFYSEFFINDLAVAEEHLYLGAYWGSLRVVEVTDASQPQESAFLSPAHSSENTNHVIVSGRYVYSLVDGRLSIVDISDPIGLVEVSYLDLFEMGSDFDAIALQGEYIYAVRNARDKENLYIINVADPGQPELVNQLAVQGEICAIATSGIYLYLITLEQNCFNGDDAAGRLLTINVSNPMQTAVVSTLVLDQAETTVGFYRMALYVSGPYAYVAADDLWVVDISDPLAPRQVGFLDTPGNAGEVVVEGEVVYVADGAGGVLVLRRRP